MGGISQDNLLRSWKEISAYLGCDVRTCHRWETDRGMPVHRAQGAESKSPVFAYKDELDRWFQGTFKNSNRLREKAPYRPVPWLKWAAAGAIVAGPGRTLSLLRGKPRPGPAGRFHDRRVLSRYPGQAEARALALSIRSLRTSCPRASSGREFQALSRNPDNSLPLPDHQGISTAMGTPKSSSHRKRMRRQTGSGRLYCFDRKGTEIWRFDAGKELNCGEKVFSPDYRIPGFVCHDTDGDGHLETLVFAFQKPDWPCQMALLDSSGRRLGEYWNSGYLEIPRLSRHQRRRP